MVNPGYGPRCLALLAEGVDAASALKQVRSADPDHDVRQVGLVDASGAVAGFTGARCLDYLGQESGDGFSVQANMMRRPGVPEAMAAAYTSTSGSLATRLLAALVAAEAAGGDARGVMSAALIVVDGSVRPEAWEGVLIDIRVDHHNDPLGELARLIGVAEAYRLCDEAEAALVTGDGAAALRGAEAGLALLPGEGNLVLSYIAALAGAGRLDEARQESQNLIAGEPGWAVVLRTIVERGLMPLPDGVTVDMLLGGGA
jgi:uncharacterized Ntn-hydrolase superfamily protein